MSRLASATLDRYVKMPTNRIVEFAKAKDHAEVSNVNDFAITVDCFFDDPKCEDIVRVIVSVNRPGLLSFMFPYSEDILVNTRPEPGSKTADAADEGEKD